MDINEILEEVIDKNTSGGSIRLQCHCGRYHFAWADADWDEGEYEELIKKSDEKPNDYINHYNEHYISHINFNGSDFVVGCECNWHHKYAAFMWHERKIIVEFLKKCKIHKVKEAIEIDKLMSDVDA